jgi:energy-coupling factor transporter ATP-binding protein EcfA2
MTLQYFGGDDIITLAEQYLKNCNKKGEKKALLIAGAPGVGKTYLTACLAERHNVEHILINASEEKTQASITDILVTVRQRGARVIVVLDECEAMRTASLDKIIKATTVPLILCCNFEDDIDQDIKSQCITGKIKVPYWWTFKQFLIARMESLGIPIPRNIDVLAKCARSFRHAERLIDDPDDIAPEPIETKQSQVERVFSGNPPEYFIMKPDELLNWVHDNAHVPELASRVSVILEHAYLDDYHENRYAFALLSTVRSNNKVDIPRSFRLMKKIKEDVEGTKNADKEAALSNVKVDLSKVDVTAIKVGASLFDGLDDIDLNSLK